MPPHIDVEEIRAQRRLLAWYDQHARVLPWRVSPQARERGILPNPYIVWISEVMLQQTTSAVVGPRLLRFVARFPDVAALACAPVEAVLQEWAGLGYYARARALHAAAQIMAQAGMPQSAAGLRLLPGIGTYTASAIAAIAFDEAQAPVDANIARIMARLYGLTRANGALRPAIQAASERLLVRERPGDWAQALMDLGAEICRPRAPACPACPLAAICHGQSAGPELFPGPRLKPAKPQRYGVCFLLERAGSLWLERRPAKGLLGGMLGLPGGPWTHALFQQNRDDRAVENGLDAGVDALRFAPVAAHWRAAGRISHSFTHFHLHLEVLAGRSADQPAGRGQWVSIADWAQAGLPTVFAKAVAMALTVDLAP